MEAKTSKAQIKVWEAKERLYNEIKDLPSEDRIKYLIAKAKKGVAHIKMVRQKAN